MTKVATIAVLLLLATACSSGAPTAVSTVPPGTTPAADGGPGASPGDADSADDAAQQDPASGEQDSPPATKTSGPGERPAEARSVFAPPAGRYVYDATGFMQFGTGPTAQRQDFHPEQTDDVTSSQRGGVLELRVDTTFGPDMSQEELYDVDEREARLTRIVSRQGSGATQTTETITPDPPIPVARFPYRVGDGWPFQWKDEALGIQATGTVSILRPEEVTTGKGKVQAIVLEIHQKLSGAINGEFRSTLWINPRTGVQARREAVQDTESSFGQSHVEMTAVLRDGPSA